MFKKNPKKILVGVFFVTLLFFYVVSIKEGANLSSEVVYFKKGESSQEFIKDLYNRGYIKNKLSYFTVLALLKLKKEIDYGGFSLRKNLTAVALHGSLMTPEYKYVSVVEGMRKGEIADRVGTTLGWEEKKTKEFQMEYPICAFAGKEGYFAAGDYLIKKNAKIQSVQDTMQGEFKENLEELGILHDENLGQIITVASLIQREASGKSDMRLISGIIWNRLEIGMPLQIDATLQYIKGDEKIWWPRVIPEDKVLESPFNTYQNTGLPPQPISSPGIMSIKAAINPVNTDCFFYLHDSSGNIHCSTNYKGHLNNIKRYLKSI